MVGLKDVQSVICQYYLFKVPIIVHSDMTFTTTLQASDQFCILCTTHLAACKKVCNWLKSGSCATDIYAYKSVVLLPIHWHVAYHAVVSPSGDYRCNPMGGGTAI